MKALAKRFNPDSKREVYVAELHSRNRRKEKDWATYADILKGLADKAYPDLEEAARERLALNQFLGELDKPQVAFGVRQGRPKGLDEAVSLTIELESYIGGSHGKPARINFSQVDAELPNASASTTVAEEQECSGVLAVTLQSINERLQRLELRLKNSEAITEREEQREPRKPRCWNCGKRGHIARLCRSRDSTQQQGNYRPSAAGANCQRDNQLMAQNDLIVSVPRVFDQQLCLEPDSPVWNKKFGATLIVTGDITVGAILGLDFLENHKCCIDCGAKILTFPQNKLSVQVHHVMPVKVEAPIECPAIGLVTLEKIVVPPSSEMEVMVKQASPGMKVASMSQLHEDCITQNISAVTEHIPLSQGDQEALWSMVCKVGDHLNDGEKELVFHLLMEYADVFAFNSGQIGRTNILKHRIDTGNTPPVHLLPRRIPQSRREEMAKLVKDMLEQGAIQQSDSPWSSPVVLVKKKDGSVRFCVDYRKVNSVTRKDAYPLPRVDDTLDTLAGSRLFTTLDLASGYWQVEVAEEDQPKTAFTTPEGLFQFRVMPFGLCNAPATFQRLMDRVLGGLKWSSCLVYLDDIIIVGTSFSEHLRNLAGVLQRLRQAGLKLKPSKCKWCQKSVTFLGHIVSEEGVAADPSKTAVVAGWPPPQSKREMQQFLGLANYYRKFVKNFAAIAKPLHRLTEKNTDFKWTVECQHAFDVLRACLSSPPVLSYPDYSRRFVLDTDASDIGIGAVLSQEDATGSEVVIAYASRTLSRPEQRYCVTRKELLAAVEFIHHFRQYLLGREFTLRTDHSSLVWLRNFKEPEGQLARWLEKLQEYSFSVVHRQGTKHGNADALSRVPCRQCGRESHETTPKGDVIEGSVTSLPCTSYTPQWIRQQQLDDCSIRPVYQALESKLMLSADEVKPWSREEKMRNLLKERFYWPSCADGCNGIVERFNRTLLGMLATTVDSYPSSWEQNIRRVCLAYNSSVHASTGFSPFFLMFGRQVKLPVDLMYGTTQGKETAVMEYVKNLKDGLLEAYALVRDRCETEHKRQKSIYDRKLYHLNNPGSCTGPGKDPIKWWKGSETPPTSCKVLLGEGDHRSSILTADEVVLPTPKPGEQCELLEEDEDYAAPVAPPNELPAAGPGDQPAPQRRYPDRNRRQPDRYGPFIKH
eukprot:Em0020g608a